MKQILLSGVKPTGQLHIGNYFGAIKQFINLQNDYETRVFIADLHALTTVNDPDKLKQETINITAAYIALGIDPEKVLIFKQSDIPQVTELTWIFNCILTMPYLMRAHAFKDAEAKNKDINVGTFDYPVLMAADILIQDSDIVPVGRDQKQHVEYSRDIAEKFNRIFGKDEVVLKLPKEIIIENTETVPGIDGQKMSKSYNNVIPLFASDEEIDKIVMSIITDSDGDVPKNVYAIHKLFKTEDELKEVYKANKGKYKILKEALAQDIKNFIGPRREKYNELVNNPDYIIDLLDKNGKKVNQIVEEKMNIIRKLVGYNLK
jgi:tryptophanyl-tRNA synthetase